MEKKGNGEQVRQISGAGASVRGEGARGESRCLEMGSSGGGCPPRLEDSEPLGQSKTNPKSGRSGRGREQGGGGGEGTGRGPRSVNSKRSDQRSGEEKPNLGMDSQKGRKEGKGKETLSVWVWGEKGKVTTEWNLKSLRKRRKRGEKHFLGRFNARSRKKTQRRKRGKTKDRGET